MFPPTLKNHHRNHDPIVYSFKYVNPLKEQVYIQQIYRWEWQERCSVTSLLMTENKRNLSATITL
jgi:hypothetical protein